MKMKKILAMALASAMVLSLGACGNSGSNTSVQIPAQAATAQRQPAQHLPVQQTKIPM